LKLRAQGPARARIDTRQYQASHVHTPRGRVSGASRTPRPTRPSRSTGPTPRPGKRLADGEWIVFP